MQRSLSEREQFKVFTVQLHKKMYGEESSFSGSTGWQWGFCKRHRIHNLSLEGEKLSADTEASATFITSFNEFVEEHQLTLNQIFNCDETGLNFRLLPNKTLAASFEHSADGRKLSKERVTINACANATVTIKLPLQVIGKAKRPRCFRGLRMELLPVEYCGQKSAWMNSEICSCLVSQLIHPYSTQRAIFSWLGAKSCSGTG